MRGGSAAHRRPYEEDAQVLAQVGTPNDLLCGGRRGATGGGEHGLLPTNAGSHGFSTPAGHVDGESEYERVVDGREPASFVYPLHLRVKHGTGSYDTITGGAGTGASCGGSEATDGSDAYDITTHTATGSSLNHRYERAPCLQSHSEDGARKAHVVDHDH